MSKVASGRRNSMTVRDSIIWTRVGEPGHDACQLLEGVSTWKLLGKAEFRSAGELVALDYEVVCDSVWRTLRGNVSGWWGDKNVALEIKRVANTVWTMNGTVVDGLDSCIDLDLGFSPATNLISIRRLALSVGQRAYVPAAWLDLPIGSLERLDQSYECRTGSTFWYQAPRFDYRALLEVSESGFVRRYPGLWEQVADDNHSPRA